MPKITRFFLAFTTVFTLIITTTACASGGMQGLSQNMETFGDITRATEDVVDDVGDTAREVGRTAEETHEAARSIKALGKDAVAVRVINADNAANVTFSIPGHTGDIPLQPGQYYSTAVPVKWPAGLVRFWVVAYVRTPNGTEDVVKMSFEREYDVDELRDLYMVPLFIERMDDTDEYVIHNGD